MPVKVNQRRRVTVGNLLKTREVAARLGKTPQTVRNYARKGILPFTRITETSPFMFAEKVIDEFVRRIHGEEKSATHQDPEQASDQDRQD